MTAKTKATPEKSSERIRSPRGLQVSASMALLFISGFAGLVYQVLWMKQLGLLFGNTAQATSATLAAFFAGLGIGSWWWGKRMASAGNPLRLYALLEGGIALTALIYFVILKIFYGVYPLAYDAISGAAWMVALKFGLALLLVFPPAFFMGGTVPAVGQALIRDRSAFGKRASFIYGINTLGAALGVSCTAFLLVPALGFRLSYALAILLSAAVGGSAWQLSRRWAAPASCASEEKERVAAGIAADAPGGGDKVPGASLRAAPERLAIPLLCFFSGFAVLALEVLWTRMFAQVHENSVYSFSIILTVVLSCLAGGAWISSALSRLKCPPLLMLGTFTVLGGAILVFAPALFMHVTHDLQPLSSLEPWGEYVRGLFGMGFAAMGIPLLALGTVFPFLMKAVEREATIPGRMLGRLLAINTAGAIAGALVCGFVLLPGMGMWRTMRLLTAGYLIVGLLVPYGWTRAGTACRLAGVLSLLLLFTSLDPATLPTQGKHPRLAEAKILETWEGSDCTVAVIEEPDGNRTITLNAGYTLGSTGAYREQANQSRIPLYLFPDTESIFYIGLGTGMSAGAALAPQFPSVKRIVSSELTPAVVAAAKAYIPDKMTGGVFTDPRSTVLVEDGRHYLMAADKTFDMINSDLFLPYRRGAGSLYSLDHYRSAAERLAPGGVFVQWLPLFQITEFEFGVIVRTMLEAFGQVSMWRNNFTPGSEKVALIARLQPAPLDRLPVASRKDMFRGLGSLDWRSASPGKVHASPDNILFFYCGNLTAAESMFEDYPVNTDDRPVIEYQTPMRFREVAANNRVIWFVGPKLTNLTRKLLLNCPVDEDPLLTEQSPAARHRVMAGLAFHRALVGKALGQPEPSRRDWAQFKREWQKSIQ